MRQIRLIDLEWNCWNGFSIEILSLEFNGFEGTLLGTSFAFGDYWHVYILFFQFEIKSPFV